MASKSDPRRIDAASADVAAHKQSSFSSGPPASAPAGGSNPFSGFSIPSGGGSHFGRSLFLLLIGAFGLFLLVSKGSDGKPRIESVLSAFQGLGQLGTKAPTVPVVAKKGTKVKA